jgi:hypothetical protein
MSDRFRHARQGGGYPHLSQAAFAPSAARRTALAAECTFQKSTAIVAINLSLEPSPFRPRIAQTMPHLRQCDAIAAGRYASVRL